MNLRVVALESQLVSILYSIKYQPILWTIHAVKHINDQNTGNLNTRQKAGMCKLQVVSCKGGAEEKDLVFPVPKVGFGTVGSSMAVLTIRWVF